MTAVGSTIGKLKLLAILGIVFTTTAASIPLTPDKSDVPSRNVTTAPAGDAAPVDAREAASDEPDQPADKSPDSERSDASPATKPAKDEHDVAQVEVFVPSITQLAASFEDSKTAEIFEAIRNLMPEPDDIADEEQFDVAALSKLSEHILSWPDTSLAFTTYAQDRDGRPRWAIQVDWPFDAVVERMKTLFADESAGKVLGKIQLVKEDGDAWRVELPDMVLAYIRPADRGALITGTRTLNPPTNIFGVAESADTKGRSRQTRLFCRLNLDAEDEGSKNAMFTALVGVNSIDYELRLLKNGNWREMFVVKWNAMIGLAAKAIFQKTKNQFNCPKDAYATAVFNLGALTEAAPDGITGLPAGTIGSRTTGEMAFSLVPGTGFLPFPDTYFQFRTGRRHVMADKIRGAIKKDAAKRAEDDRRPAWYEEEIDGSVVFWKDPSADGGYGLAPATSRTVIFFHPPMTDAEKAEGSDDEESDESDAEESESDDAMWRTVVIANTTTWPDDAVRNFRDKIKSARKLPSSKKMDWQARINWRRAYELAYPYVALATGLSPDTTMPPEPVEFADVLSDSRVDVKISVGGFLARHVGPVPIGGLYVPAIAGVTLNTSADPGSDIAREQTACRRLRVLQHHCKLFKKDYGRWPATIAELDGYVDFASHPQLLRLRDRNVGFLQGFASAFTIDEKPDAKKSDDDILDEDIDDSLYEIDWSDNDADWRLKLREGEFVAYKTIYIDAEGHIHRVLKTKTEATDADEASESESPKI